MAPELFNKAPPRKVWVVFFIFVLVWNIPNLLPWEQNLYPDTYWMDMQERLFKCMLLAAMFIALFSQPWIVWLTSWILGLWWLPISMAVRYVSESPITANLVGMAIASSPGEIKNLILTLPPSIYVSLAGWNLACGATFLYLKRQSTWFWAGRVRGKIFVYCGLLLAVPLITAMDRTLSIAPTPQASEAIDPFKEGDRSIGSDAELPRAFPYELPWAIAQYWQARQVIDKAIMHMQEAPTRHALHIHSRSPEVVVLVIGESSSRRIWQLFNNSEAPTTPRLQERIDQGEYLLPFSNVVAQSTSTRQAVPSMLTPQPLLWPDGKPNPNATRSIVSLAAKADYQTVWLSNQAAIGQFDGVIAAYANEAQTRIFLNPSSFSQQGSYDAVILPHLQRHLAGKEKAFVVLHTMGSHFRFDHRYPEGFGPFPTPRSTGDAYRNSIAYTDALLDNVIKILKQDGRSSIMLYVSDHGQGLADEQCKKNDTNRVTIDAYEVPAIVWLSTKYVTANNEIAALLRKRAQSPYTTGAVYQTLHDLISTAIHSSNEMPSFLHDLPHHSVQMVVSADMRWVDFQEAAARDPCFIRAR